MRVGCVHRSTVQSKPVTCRCSSKTNGGGVIASKRLTFDSIGVPWKAAQVR